MSADAVNCEGLLLPKSEENRLFPGLSNRLDFFELLRRLERDGELGVRLGDPGERNAIDLHIVQPADMAFASREVADVDQYHQTGRPRSVVVTCRHFGLFAPYGPLPIHVTEHARLEWLNRRNSAFQEFTALLSQRLAVLHYRAWAQLNVALGHERRGSNAFLRHIHHLSGIQEAIPENEHVRLVRTRFAGAYLPDRRGLRTLNHILTNYFDLPCRLMPRFARWIDDGEGAVRQRMAKLGQTRVGRRFYDMQHSIKIEVGPLTASEYPGFQPGGEKLAALLAICRNYVGSQLMFDVDLVINTHKEMSARLGSGKLSRNGWLKTRQGFYTQTVFQQII
ncbi:type VI secretion system baseplate subunit TssG [Pantoea sp. y20]